MTKGSKHAAPQNLAAYRSLSLSVSLSLSLSLFMRNVLLYYQNAWDMGGLSGNHRLRARIGKRSICCQLSRKLAADLEVLRGSNRLYRVKANQRFFSRWTPRLWGRSFETAPVLSRSEVSSRLSQSSEAAWPRRSPLTFRTDFRFGWSHRFTVQARACRRGKLRQEFCMHAGTLGGSTIIIVVVIIEPWYEPQPVARESPTSVM